MQTGAKHGITCIMQTNQVEQNHLYLAEFLATFSPIGIPKLGAFKENQCLHIGCCIDGTCFALDHVPCLHSWQEAVEHVQRTHMLLQEKGVKKKEIKAGPATIANAPRSCFVASNSLCCRIGSGWLLGHYEP